jgi:DNA primase
MSALDKAIETAKRDLDGRSAMEAIERMKAERDTLRRAIGTGTVWADGTSS